MNDWLNKLMQMLQMNPGQMDQLASRAAMVSPPPQMGGQFPQMGGQPPQMGGQSQQMGGQSPYSLVQPNAGIPSLGSPAPMTSPQQPQQAQQEPQSLAEILGNMQPDQLMQIQKMIAGGRQQQMPGQMSGQMPGQMPGQMMGMPQRGQMMPQRGQIRFPQMPTIPRQNDSSLRSLGGMYG